jgi:hypothetical protein
MRRAEVVHPEGFQDLRKHLLECRGIRCPFFEEVVVAFCRAYPVKKMVPSDRIQANCICTREGFEDCPLFREVMARLEGTRATAEGGEPRGEGGAGSSTE